MGLVNLEGMTVFEVAAGVNVNLNTGYARLRAARRQLREKLKRLRSQEPRPA
ncbi:hypothetical protein ACFL5O_07780 [Myxococcota bacterium]